MSRRSVGAALAVFLVGVIGVWLIKPIGDACADLGKLPAGSTGSSSPSFGPPLTRTCTYTTTDGTEAMKRYVPVVDWLVLAVVAGVAGAGVALAGPGPGTAQPAPDPRPKRSPRRGRAARAPRESPTPRPAKGTQAAPVGEAPPPPPQSAQDRGAEREREREERARRRGGG